MLWPNAAQVTEMEPRRTAADIPTKIITAEHLVVDAKAAEEAGCRLGLPFDQAAPTPPASPAVR